MSLTILSKFKSLLRPLSKTERDLLTLLLLADGCRDPIVVWKGRNTIIDGHHRYDICTEKGIPYKIVEMEFPDEAEASLWIISNQLGRRNLTPDQDLMRKGMRYLSEVKTATNPKGLGGKSGKIDVYQNDTHQSSTRERIAAEEGVGPATISRCAQIAKEAKKAGIGITDLGHDAPKEKKEEFKAIKSKVNRSGDHKPKKAKPGADRADPLHNRDIGKLEPKWTHGLLEKYRSTEPSRIVLGGSGRHPKEVQLDRLFPNIGHPTHVTLINGGCESPDIWEKVNSTPVSRQMDVARDLMNGGDGETAVEPEYKWVASRPFPSPPRDGWAEYCGTDYEGTEIYKFITHLETFVDWCVRNQAAFASAKAGLGGRRGLLRNMAQTYREAAERGAAGRWFETIDRLAGLDREINGDTKFYKQLNKS